MNPQRFARDAQRLGSWDCCVIPFQHTPLTAATNPVKAVYEMLAAGKPVGVSVRLPELVPIATYPAPGIYATRTPARGQRPMVLYRQTPPSRRAHFERSG